MFGVRIGGWPFDGRRQAKVNLVSMSEQNRSMLPREHRQV